MNKVFKACIEDSQGLPRNLLSSFSSRGALRCAAESCWRWMAFIAVTVAIDGSSGCSILLRNLHTLLRPFALKRPMREKLFLLYLRNVVRAPWTLTLGLITLATQDTNKSYAFREVDCNFSIPHKFLSVFPWKDLTLWDLAKCTNV